MSGRSTASSSPAADDVLSYRIGPSTVGANLERAQQRGDVTAHDDGTWELAAPLQFSTGWRFGQQSTPFPCTRLLGFLFRNVYDRKAVPFGCRTCFKVQIKPRSVRELKSVASIADTSGLAFKAGASLTVPHQAGPYSAIFYLDGLDAARAVYARLRDAVMAEPSLGAGVPMSIRRGCTEYEVHCGASDRFQFDPDLQAVETSLLARLRPVPAPVLPHRHAVFLHWLHVAYRIGDETYRDFTGGKPLYAVPVTYAPTPDQAR